MFADDAEAVGIQKFGELFDARLHMAAFVGIADGEAVARLLDDLGRRMDVRLVADGVFGGAEGFVCDEAHAVGIAHERVARDARLALIGPRHAAVDHEDGPFPRI